jgi:hypothetical protein
VQCHRSHPRTRRAAPPASPGRERRLFVCLFARTAALPADPGLPQACRPAAAEPLHGVTTGLIRAA